MEKLKRLLFENRGLRQRILKNTFWLTFGQLAGRLIRAVVIILAARILGAEGYGVFSYVISIAGVFTIFSDAGLSKILVRELAKNPEMEKAYLSAALGIKIFLIGAGAAVIILGAPYITKIPEALPLIPLAAILLIFDGLRNFSMAITRAKEKMQLEAGVEIVTNMAIVLFGVGVLLFAPSPKSLMASYTLGAGLGLAFALALLRSHFSRIRNFFDWKLCLRILKDAWPFALISFFSILMIHTDTIMIGILKTAEEVGFYSAAQRSVQILYVLPSLLAISLLPAFSRFAGKENEKLRTSLEAVLAGAFLIALPLALGGSILAPEIISFIFGSEFVPSVIPFQILLFSVLAVFPGVILSYVILAYNAQKSIIKFLSGVALANIALNLVLIPLYGIIGAATATISALVVANGFTWLRVRKINRFKVISRLGKVLASAAAMVALTLILKSAGVYFIINIILSAFLYLTIAYLAGEKTLRGLLKGWG